MGIPEAIGYLMLASPFIGLFLYVWYKDNFITALLLYAMVVVLVAFIFVAESLINTGALPL